jgi:4-amino-4-deoxychorismate lyase
MTSATQNKDQAQNTELLQLELFTTVRYAAHLASQAENRALGTYAPNSFYMFEYHLDRMVAAAVHFKQDNVLNLLQSKDKVLEILERLQNELDSLTNGFAGDVQALRVRLVTDPSEGIVISSTSPTQEVPMDVLFPARLDEGRPLDSPLYDVFICPHSTSPSPYTRYKTSERSVYTAARLACNLPAQPTADPVEVLLWNVSGELMEGSLTSVYVKRGGQWVTPPVECGGNEGTTRRWALEKRICIESRVEIDRLEEGETIRLSNGLRGFLWGTVRRNYYDDASSGSKV